LIKLFLQNILITNLLLIPYIFILRIKSFISPPSYDSIIGLSPPVDFLYTSLSPRALSFLAVFLIFLQANLINYFVNNNKLNTKNSLLAGMLFSAGTCLIPEFNQLHPIMIANTFVLLMLMQLTKVYKTYKPIKAMFMSGFYCGLAFLIVPHFMLLIVFVLQSMLILRDVNLKEFLQSVVGMLTPIILAVAISLDRTKESFVYFIDPNMHFPSINTGMELNSWIGLAALVLVLSYIIFNQNKLRKKKSVKTQKIVTLLFILMLYTLAMMLFTSAIYAQHLTTLVIPLAILFTMLLFVTKKLLVAELIHLSLVIFIILFQFDLIL